MVSLDFLAYYLPLVLFMSLLDLNVKCFTEALKGRKNSARGIAKRSPG